MVIPTTPSSSVFHHQQYNDQQQLQHHFNNLHRQGVNRTPDSIGCVNDAAAAGLQRGGLIENPQPQQQQSLAGAVNAPTQCGNAATANVEERINQIQEYIRITSTLINSIQAEKVSLIVQFKMGFLIGANSSLLNQNTFSKNKKKLQIH